MGLEGHREVQSICGEDNGQDSPGVIYRTIKTFGCPQGLVVGLTRWMRFAIMMKIIKDDVKILKINIIRDVKLVKTFLFFHIQNDSVYQLVKEKTKIHSIRYGFLIL